jgi:hypothetical protein
LRIVGFTGLAGSGKNTAAQALTTKGYVEAAFADPLKELAKELGWDGVKDDKGRKLLQDLGHGCRKVFGADFWVDRMRERIEKEWGPTGANRPVAVTDVRYQNEADLVTELGGIILKIERPDLDTSDPMYQHITEKQPIKVNWHVYNTGSVEELHQAVNHILGWVA